jgi:phosphatidylglycerol---prolipoprotein diacylglyceryl transferase
VHPIAFQLGPVTVHWYGIMMAVAFLAGLWTASRRGVRDQISPESIMDLGPWLILGTIVGARSLYVFMFWNEQFADRPVAEIFKVWEGGLVYYGGLVGATAAAMIYLRFKKMPIWKVADVVAPSIALGYVFGRIGCLLNGCCYGRECHLPWAIRFPEGPGLPTTPVHPTEVYDSLLNLGFYIFLAWLYRRKKFDGQIFGTYLVGYALLRSFVEMFRGDYPPPQHYLGGWATPAQMVSIGILAAGVALLLILPRPQVKQQ